MLNNRYELLGELGEGGFAVTYKAIDHLTSRYVAIKKSKRSLALEAKIMKLLKDVPYISHLYDYFSYEGYDYIVKRYISGSSLSEIRKELQSKGMSMSRSDIESWLDSICLILDQMHRFGIIHRDISPGNLILSGETLYLIDFGGATSFTNRKYRNQDIYVHQGLHAPEYAHPEEQGPWTDLYSLAGTILFLLTGEGVPSPENRRVHDPIPEILRRSSLSGKQQNAMIRALQLDGKDRFQNAITFASYMLSADIGADCPASIHKVDYYARTTTGSKTMNQDNFMVDTQFRFADQDCSIQGEILCQDKEIHVVAVADGVSSTCNPELASMAVSQAISHFVRQYRHSDVYPELLLEGLLDNLNEKIISLSNKIGTTASTLAMFLWVGDTYYVASIGDSRIYISHNKKLKLLTTPQTYATRKMKQGEAVSQSDFNTLYSYLGKRGIIGSQMAQYISGKLSEGDVVLLCTDGIAKKIPLEKLEKYLYKSRDGKKRENVFNIMWKYAQKNEYVDNCTAIVLSFS